MNSVEKGTVLHCLKSMIDEEVCEECPLYGMTGTDHCEKDCVRLAINALEQKPCEELDFVQPHKKISVNLKPCEDAISRQQAIDTFYEYPNVSWTTLDILEKINSLPPVTTEKVGQWISNAEDDLKISEYTCSNCKSLSDEDSDFCPKCGAKMQEVKNGNI